MDRIYLIIIREDHGGTGCWVIGAFKTYKEAQEYEVEDDWLRYGYKAIESVPLGACSDF